MPQVCIAGSPHAPWDEGSPQALRLRRDQEMIAPPLIQPCAEQYTGRG